MELKQLKRWILFLLLFSVNFLEISLEATNLQNILKKLGPESNFSNLSVNQDHLKLTQTVIKAFPKESSYYSQPVVFIVYVIPVHLPAPTPTGKIQFRIDNQPFVDQALVNGSATWTISKLPPTLFTEHYIEAIYSGSEIYESSRDIWSLWVYPAKTTASITSWPNPSLLSQPVKVTVNISSISPAKAIPNGSVDFQVDGISTAIVDLSAEGKASFSTSEISVGKHEITAIYRGNENFIETHTELIQKIEKANTTIVLNSSENPSMFGQTIVFTAKVVSEIGTPTGLVQFTINGINYGNPIFINEKGEAINTVSNLASGNYGIGAYYLGEDRFNPSTIFFTQHIDLAETQAELISTENPSMYGKPISLIGKVTAKNFQPMGFSQFLVDGEYYGRTQFITKNGQAEITLPQLKAGNHQIEFNFLGNENFKPSSAYLTQQIEKAKTAGLTSSKNPSIYGKEIKITATVTAEGANPTGLIQFQLDGENFGEPQALSNKGETSVIVHHLRVGEHQITANYLGNENFNPSTTHLTQQVNKGDTSTAITSSANPSLLGDPVTFTARVSAFEVLSGSIQFEIDGENVGNPLVLNEKNEASLTISSGLKQGEHRVLATYLGNENFDSSTSAPLIEVIHVR